jgi:predicted nucleic acid-binding protein
MNAVDTNILIYVHDRRNVRKQVIAETLVRTLPRGVLLWQVACEYISASRKLEPFGYSKEKTWQDIQKLRKLWVTQLPTWEMFERTEQLLARYSLSSWDALIVAACLEVGVTKLYSEDFDASAQAEGLEIVNPFAESEPAV